MYTIISGTNREGSNTLRIATQYQEILTGMGIDVRLVSLAGIDLNRRTPELARMEEELLIPAEKFIFVLPEYNGSFPGSLKTLIDLSDIHKVWKGKKALLVGVSTGRAGNLRGMDHLAGSLNYLKVHVHHNKLPISSVDKLIQADGRIHDPATLEALTHQLNEFITY